MSTQSDDIAVIEFLPALRIGWVEWVLLVFCVAIGIGLPIGVLTAGAPQRGGSIWGIIIWAVGANAFFAFVFCRVVSRCRRVRTLRSAARRQARECLEGLRIASGDERLSAALIEGGWTEENVHAMRAADISRVAQRAGVPVPRVWVSRTAHGNPAMDGPLEELQDEHDRSPSETVPAAGRRFHPPMSGRTLVFSVLGGVPMLLLLLGAMFAFSIGFVSGHTVWSVAGAAAFLVLLMVAVANWSLTSSRATLEPRGLRVTSPVGWSRQIDLSQAIIVLASARRAPETKSELWSSLLYEPTPDQLRTVAWVIAPGMKACGVSGIDASAWTDVVRASGVAPV